MVPGTDAQGCGPALSGKWYRGEIKWTDSDQSGAAKEASAASHVRDVPVEFEKTTEQPEFDGHPAIRVRSALRKLPFTTADSLYRDEPFYVDVIFPEDEAKKAGTDLTVTLHSAIGNDTSSLGLSSFSPDVHRFAVYTTLDPVTMAHGGSGAHHGMLAHLASLALKKLMPGNMSRLKIVNGDTVTVSYGDVPASLTAYANPIFQDAARVEASLRQLEVGFNAGLANGAADGARGLDSAGIAAVQFFISSTGADQFAIIAFGVDMNGQPVDAMTRFTTGLSFGGSLILAAPRSPARRRGR
jgi:hypothetical protein